MSKQAESVYMSDEVAQAQRRKSKRGIVGGAILTAFFAFGIIEGILDKGPDHNLREGLTVYICCFIPSVFLLWRGILAGRIADTASRYETIFAADRDGVVTIEELKRFTGKSQEKIIKELKAAFGRGYFSGCALQEGGSPCVILSDARKVSPTRQGFLTVTCPNCGASNRIRVGSISMCEYCNSPLTGE